MSDLKSVLPGKHYHFVGVGGMGMAPLALFLRSAGYTVSGEDDNFHPRLFQLLKESGVSFGKMSEGQSMDGVVYSNAIPAHHETLQFAQSQNIECVRRGEFLARLSNQFNSIVIAGSHGKTTTCGMLIAALKQMGVEFSYIQGGLFAEDCLPPANYNSGTDWLVLEVDESDGSIHHFEPYHCVLVNVDWDHSDFYKTQGNLLETFSALLSRTRNTVFVNEDCEQSLKLKYEGVPEKRLSFGSTGDYRLNRFSSDVLQAGGDFGTMKLKVPFEEEFNVQNAVAALSVIHQLCGKLDESVLEDFPGIWRRQEVLFRDETLRIVEDYGHHPTEIRSLLESLTRNETDLIVVFQPHRFSRTLQFKQAFCEALSTVNKLIVMEVYGAGEAPIMGGTGRDLLALFAEQFPDVDTLFCKDGDEVLSTLSQLNIHSGTLLFLGAGDIQNVANNYVASTHKVSTIYNMSPFAHTGELSSPDVLKTDEALSLKTTLRVGGVARYYAEPETVTDLQWLLKKAKKAGLPVFFLGRGSNLIIPDEGIDGLVIRLNRERFQKLEQLEDGRIVAGCGVRLKELCGLTRKLGYGGFEFLEGIPGSVGGSLKMNAGAMGGAMSDVISAVVLMSYEGEVRTIDLEQLNFGYRHCGELDNAVALKVVFRAGLPTASDKIQEIMNEYQCSRKSTQPRRPSSGCSFKNPEGSFAGKLIDECGLKGLYVGDAEVSSVHANFIINRGGATATDVIQLINKIRQIVYTKTGYELEPEVILFGDSWSSKLEKLTKQSCTTP